MTDRWVLVLPLKAPLMTPNSQRRAHWTSVAKAKADTELLVGAAVGKAKLKKIDGPIRVRIVWYAADARKRDVDSLSVLAKAVLDTLQKKKVIEDDHFRIVQEVKLGPVVIARDNPRIEVVISRGVDAGGDLPVD